MIADPELRRCPVSNRWVAFAPERALRPIHLTHGKPHHRRDVDSMVDCPFCPGSEHLTPNEVYAIREPGSLPNGPGWQLRVVPNKYPALRPLGEMPRNVDADRLPGWGMHELVVECPEHFDDPSEMSDAAMARIAIAYRERLIALGDQPELRYASIFKNVGAEAGASLPHLHSQILATPIVPDAIQVELHTARAHYASRRTCYYCDLLRAELASEERLVAETDRFVVVCPFAPRFAYECWIVPKRHASHYEATGEADLFELGQVLKAHVRRLDRLLEVPAYNWFLHTAPLRTPRMPEYHWHFEIVPRTARAAGFEWGTGCFINAVLPERAAAELRAIDATFPR